MAVRGESRATAPGRWGSAPSWALGTGAAGMLLWLALPLLQGRVFVEDDLSAFHLPLRAFYHEALHAGDSFLWMPHLFNGFYVHGEGQAGMLHPLHLLLYRLLPLPAAFQIELWLSYPAFFLGTWLFLRRWRLPAHAALYAALLATFAGFSTNHYIHMHFIAVLAHLPWALLAIDTALRPGTRRAAAFAVTASALLGASQLLLGIPQAVFFSWTAELLYALWLIARARNLRGLLLLGAAKALALLLAAVQLLPMAEALDLSTRADPDLAFQTAISMRPVNWAQFLSPYLFDRRVFGSAAGDEPWDAPYLAAATPALLLLLALRWRRLGAMRGPVLAAAALALLGALSALGSHGFLYPVYTLIPLVNKFRAPARFIALAHFALALLSGAAFSELARGEPDPTRRRLLLLAAPAASALVTALAWAVGRGWLDWGPGWARANIMPPTPMLVGLALVVGSSLLVYLAAGGRRGALTALAVLTLIDVSLYALRHKPSGTVGEVRAWVDSPATPPGGRVEPDVYPATMNLIALHGQRGPSGYASLVPRQTLDFSRAPALRLAGVHWREARHGTSPALNDAFARGEAWVPLDHPMPRARLVAHAVVSPEPATALADIDPARTALVDAPLDLDPGPPGTAEVVRDRPGDIRVGVEAPGRRILVVNESMHPGWAATVDGEPVPVTQCYGAFLGAVVPPGTHDVSFRFRPRSFRLGALLSLLGLAALPVLAAAPGPRLGREPAPR